MSTDGHEGLSAEARVFWTAFALVYGLILGFSLCLTGCASPSQEAKRAYIGISYADEVNACSDKATAAKDMAVYDKCMDDVDTRFGLRKAQDGGAE